MGLIKDGLIMIGAFVLAQILGHAVWNLFEVFE